MEPFVIFEDEHLLAVHKPAGLNPHSPGEFSPEGLHEWLQRRRREKIATIHRLDKETSGVMLFGKTPLANRSLTEQFTLKTARKTYIFLTANQPPAKRIRITTPIDGKPAATTFEAAGERGGFALVRAEPETGRTHQIRIHAAEAGFPVAGDELYEKPMTSLPRMMLHAAAVEVRHPQSGEVMRFEAPEPASFTSRDWIVAARELRSLLFDPAETNAYRLLSGKADGHAEAVVDSYAGQLLVQWYAEPKGSLLTELKGHKLIERSMEKQPSGETAAPEERFEIVENGLKFSVSLQAGYSTGIFLDQRENRRRLLGMDLSGKTVLNCFAYTCAFSVAAARAGATVTSLDLSKRYLDWGRENFRLNAINPDTHDFIFGDCFDWMKRLGKKGRQFDLVMIDPPTFSRAKSGTTFRAEKDFPKLITLAAPLLKPGGTLFLSTNARGLTPQQFLADIRRGEPRADKIEFVTQPVDFRVAAGEKPYLKTAWVQLS